MALIAVPAALKATTPQNSYVLHCGGCHGLEGVSNSRLVPDLKDQIGYFMYLSEGRRYIVRLPNVAFSTTSDDELTGLLNFVVFDLGGASVPKQAKPYTVTEVSALRRQPLTEQSLLQLRGRMVQTLIRDYHATLGLRLYGEDYTASPPPQDRP